MRFVSTLRGRLIVSHLAAVLVGVIAIVLTAGPLTKRFFSGHIADMGFTTDMMSGGASSMMGQLESSLADSYGSALSVALVVSALTAVVASIVAARWIASPVEQMSHAARRLARGEYRERVPVPDGAELATLAEDINTLADSLANSEEARLRLINEIAHELRTPLTTIEGYMEGLLDGVFEPTDEVFGATAREAGRLKRLADDLSIVSRAEEGVLPLRLENVDLGDLVVAATDRLSPLFLEKEIAVTVQHDGQHHVSGDRDRLTQVFTNILGNAITYTEPGGLVEIVIRREGESAKVSISDTGKGLAEKDLVWIFERFHRVDASLPGGTGIGLTVARSIVRRHGGDITAHSIGRDAGSRFTVSIPISD